MRLLFALLAIAVLTPIDFAAAGPQNWAQCTQDATNMRGLRSCSTLKDDIALCQNQRSGQGIQGPIACLENFVSQWTRVVEGEDRFLGPVDGRPSFGDWLAERDALCRSEEQIRLSTERYGEGHAGFEAARCEMQQTLRRAIDSAARRRGFR